MIIENSWALELGTLVGNVGTGGAPGFHDVIQAHFDDSCLELLHGTLVVFWRTSLCRAVKENTCTERTKPAPTAGMEPSFCKSVILSPSVSPESVEQILDDLR